MDRVVTVLSVTPSAEDQARLMEIFSHSNWRLYQAQTCRQAIEYVGDRRPAVVICDEALPDGDWKELSRRLVEASPFSPVLIVASRNPNVALWVEVLNLGAYDVLWKPFDKPELMRAVSAAWLYWKVTRAPEHRNRRTPSPPTALVSRAGSIR